MRAAPQVPVPTRGSILHLRSPSCLGFSFPCLAFYKNSPSCGEGRKSVSGSKAGNETEHGNGPCMNTCSDTSPLCRPGPRPRLLGCAHLEGKPVCPSRRSRPGGRQVHGPAFSLRAVFLWLLAQEVIFNPIKIRRTYGKWIGLQSGLALAFNSLLMLIPVHSKNSRYTLSLSREFSK